MEPKYSWYDMITVYSPIIVRLQIKLFSLFIPPFWKSSFWLVNSSRINGLSCIHLVPDEASSMSHRDLWGINSYITACDKDWFAAFHTLGVIIFCSCPMRDTRWCPSSLAKLVRTTPISLWFMVEISILAIVYKPTYNWGGITFDPAFGRQTFQVHVRVTVFSWTASQTLAWIIPFMQAKSKPLVF